jgi:diaminobutyrate-2-oxoglutarate transaminase
MRKLASDVGAVLIADEVQIGLGRIISWGAATRSNLIRVFVLSMRSVAGSLALIVYRSELDAWEPTPEPFRGNAMGFAAGTATMRYWSAMDSWTRSHDD